jgi:hypothetical protein
MVWSVKDLSWEPLLFGYQGPRCCTVMVWCEHSCRRRMNMCERIIGVPLELASSCRFLSEIPAGVTGITTPGLGGALVRRGAKRTSGRRVTAKRRQRSAARRAAGSRSDLMVPLTQGNSPRRTLWREAKRQPADLAKGNMLNTSRFSRMSTELGQITTGILRGRRICWLKNRML